MLTQEGDASLMVKNCTLWTLWDRDVPRLDSQGTKFPACTLLPSQGYLPLNNTGGPDGYPAI
jgi:hypothetical protein